MLAHRLPKHACTEHGLRIPPTWARLRKKHEASPVHVFFVSFSPAGTLWDAIRDGVFQETRNGVVQRNWPAIYQTLLELASALRYLHSLNLVHRDLKPQVGFAKDTREKAPYFTFAKHRSCIEHLSVATTDT